LLDENNKDVSVLCSSPTTKYQIFGYKKFAYGVQFHLEIRKTTVDDWAAVPEYKSALEQSLGSEALPEMENVVNTEISTMQYQCNMLYQNFLKIISD
jgi:GMP synthase-like glutamine amidotransferase